MPCPYRIQTYKAQIPSLFAYNAVNAAVQETIRASVPPTSPWQVRESEGTYFARGQKDAKPGDRRVGVVWHTQGSGKSLTRQGKGTSPP